MPGQCPTQHAPCRRSKRTLAQGRDFRGGLPVPLICTRHQRTGNRRRWQSRLRMFEKPQDTSNRPEPGGYRKKPPDMLLGDVGVLRLRCCRSGVLLAETSEHTKADTNVDFSEGCDCPREGARGVLAGCGCVWCTAAPPIPPGPPRGQPQGSAASPHAAPRLDHEA